jgi:hypothetical protein
VYVKLPISRRDEEILRLYVEEGWAQKDIMVKVGISQSTVVRVLDVAGVQRIIGERRPSKYYIYQKGCNDCGDPLTPLNMVTNKRGCRTRCVVCWRKHNRKDHLRRRYGLEVAEYKRLVELQEGRCAICGEEKELDIDHNHSSGKSRALLCTQCNLRIGFLETVGPELSKYLEYLAQHA